VACTGTKVRTSPIASPGIATETTESAESTGSRARSVSTTATAEEIFEEAGETSASTAEATEVEALERIAACSAPAITTGTNTATKASATEGISLSPLLAILIILGALIWIRNHLIRLVQRLELCLRLRVVRVQIGMKLLCTFTICSSDILLWDVLVYTENLVIINKCHIIKPPIF